jgi:hypothetical protein
MSAAFAPAAVLKRVLSFKNPRGSSVIAFLHEKDILTMLKASMK